jgi:DNA-directed RNA polymerase specialized sigma24 family protein
VSDKPRCRPLPPSVIEGRAAPEPTDKDELERLYDALDELPAAERTAVIASYAYDEGVVGAAIEVDVETAEADRLGQRGLSLLREALEPRD